MELIFHYFLLCEKVPEIKYPYCQISNTADLGGYFSKKLRRAAHLRVHRSQKQINYFTTDLLLLLKNQHSQEQPNNYGILQSPSLLIPLCATLCCCCHCCCKLSHPLVLLVIFVRHPSMFESAVLLSSIGCCLLFLSHCPPPT
jgi:hypothetical protein